MDLNLPMKKRSFRGEVACQGHCIHCGYLEDTCPLTQFVPSSLCSIGMVLPFCNRKRSDNDLNSTLLFFMYITTTTTTTKIQRRVVKS